MYSVVTEWCLSGLLCTALSSVHTIQGCIKQCSDGNTTCCTSSPGQAACFKIRPGLFSLPSVCSSKATRWLLLPAVLLTAFQTDSQKLACCMLQCSTPLPQCSATGSLQPNSSINSPTYGLQLGVCATTSQLTTIEPSEPLSDLRGPFILKHAVCLDGNVLGRWLAAFAIL